MQETIEKIVKKANKILRNNEEYKEDEAMQVQYVLLDKDNKIDDIVCYGWDDIVSIDSKTFEIDPIHDWAFNYDNDLFEQLQKGYKIGYMTDNAHYDIWCLINEWYPEDIEYKDGLNLYIKYCVDNGITKEYLDKKLELDAPYIMNFLEESALDETMTCKGNTIENNVEKEKILNIKFIGIDNWDRPVYKDKNGIIYKDINLGRGILALTTSANNEFYGEPECLIKDNVKIKIVQKLENEQERRSNEQDR